MQIIICDDEPYYRELLHEKILQDGFAHDYDVEVAEYGSGAQLVEAVDRGVSADVYFLDVQMEEGTDDGIRAARELRRRGEHGLIVYVTGFIDYVQTGYEVRAFRYLLKNQMTDQLSQVLYDIRQELSGQVYMFRSGGEQIRVDKRQILYFESDKRMIRLVTAVDEYRFYGNLDQAEQELGETFLRCHKSYLVNVEGIQKFSGMEIRMQGGAVIPVSRSFAKEVKRRLMFGCR